MVDYFSNHIFTLFLIIIVSVAFVLLMNVLLLYLKIKVAIRKFVKPELEQKRLTYVNYKWTGLWGCGDFKDEMEFALFKTGLHTASVYSYIYYKSAGTTKRVTIRIDLINEVIDKVLYSDKL